MIAACSSLERWTNISHISNIMNSCFNTPLSSARCPYVKHRWMYVCVSSCEKCHNTQTHRPHTASSSSVNMEPCLSFHFQKLGWPRLQVSADSPLEKALANIIRRKWMQTLANVILSIAINLPPFFLYQNSAITLWFQGHHYWWRIWIQYSTLPKYIQGLLLFVYLLIYFR